jgi:hypothetical protein
MSSTAVVGGHEAMASQRVEDGQVVQKLVSLAGESWSVRR